eukprot:5275567-Pleurochrysis_carterae.AAC.1
MPGGLAFRFASPRSSGFKPFRGNWHNFEIGTISSSFSRLFQASQFYVSRHVCFCRLHHIRPEQFLSLFACAGHNFGAPVSLSLRASPAILRVWLALSSTVATPRFIARFVCAADQACD